MSLLRKLERLHHGPRHHLEAGEKEWVEHRLLWLKNQFGLEPLQRAPLTPGSALLPAKWNCSEEAGANLLTRLCEFMRVDPARLQLEYYLQTLPKNLKRAFMGNTQESGAAGLYIESEESERLIIALEVEGLRRPADLAATLCHELGHVHLLADRRIAREEDDGEALTDLLTVYFGAGIFTANSEFQFQQWQDTVSQGWSTNRRGYLPERVWGYGLASYAWMRGEERPEWAKYLRQNIRYYFDDSLYYLTTTRETTLPFTISQAG